MARVDDNEPHAALARLDDCGRMGEPREAWIVAPQDQAAALADFRHGAAKAAAHADTAHAEGVSGGEGATPTAEVETVECTTDPTQYEWDCCSTMHRCDR